MFDQSGFVIWSAIIHDKNFIVIVLDESFGIKSTLSYRMKCSDYLHNFDIYLNIAHYYFDSSWFAIFPDYVVNGKLSQGNLRVNLSGVVQRQLSVKL